MATWDDVRRLVAALPGTDEHASYGGHPSWRVRQQAFVWDRPLRRADRSALEEEAPAESEPVLGVRVADEGVKAALIADGPDAFFTTPHFDGYAAVLVRLEQIPLPGLAELVRGRMATVRPQAPAGRVRPAGCTTSQEREGSAGSIPRPPPTAA
jgi:hypothetical protein